MTQPSWTAYRCVCSNAVVCLALNLAVGCDRGDHPELAPVRGRVTLGGEPLAGALVLYESEGGGRGSRGRTREDGTYELVYLRDMLGARIGKHRVRITTATEMNPVERVPSKYNKASTLVAEVSDQGEAIDFALDTK